MKQLTDEKTRIILMDDLCNYFKNMPAEPSWKGTAFQLYRLATANPMNDGIPICLHAVGRVLDSLVKEGHAQFIHSEGLWSIPRSPLINIIQQQPMNTIQPNTPEEQKIILAAHPDKLECCAIGNEILSTDYGTGWQDLGTTSGGLYFDALRYRIKNQPSHR